MKISFTFPKYRSNYSFDWNKGTIETFSAINKAYHQLVSSAIYNASEGRKYTARGNAEACRLLISTFGKRIDKK